MNESKHEDRRDDNRLAEAIELLARVLYGLGKRNNNNAILGRLGRADRECAPSRTDSAISQFTNSRSGFNSLGRLLTVFWKSGIVEGMKTTLSLLAVALLAFSSSAQTNTPPADPVISPFTVADNTNAPTVTNFWGPQLGQVLDFFSQTGSNWSFVPFITYLSDEKDIGGGIAALYSISDYAGAMLRLDYFDDQIFMPSGNFQLQLPLTLAGKFQVVPFAFTGVATSMNTGEDDGEAIGIIGTGLGLRVSKGIGVVYDVEHWTSHPGIQHRLGVLFRF